jgi:hypothetical protein
VAFVILFPTEPDLVFGLFVPVAVLEGAEVFRGPFAFFLGEGLSVAARFGAGKLLLLKLLLIDMASEPFIMCELPGRALATGMREPPLWLFAWK